MRTPAPGHRADIRDALYCALLEQHELGVAACDVHGVLTMMSPAMEETFGVRFSRTSERAWSRCYHLHDPDGEPLAPGQDPLARALRGETVTDVLMSVRRPGRPMRLLRCNAFQLHDERGELLGAAAFTVDVTARAVEQRRLDQLRDRIVETVNHELRTPLTVVRAHLEHLEDWDERIPDQAAKSLHAMRRAANRLIEVVDRISEIADQARPRRRS